MKRIKNYISVVIAVTFVSTAFAQQTAQTNLYTHNKYSFNPAYAGASGCTEVNFSHLNQWVKVDGAPNTNFLSANTRIGKSLGLGANVVVDKIGMLQNISASGSVAYGLTFAKHHEVRLGVSAGYFQMRVDPSGAIAFDAGDNIIEGGVQTSNSITTDAGILYRFKGLELSFASKQLIETRSKFNYTNLEGYGLKRHFVGYAGYGILLNKRFTLTPSVFYKGLNNTNQFDINVDVNYNDFIYGGVGYRTGVGLVGRIGVSIRKLFFIGYAYEVPMHNIASKSAGSHEIAIGLKFCKKDKETPNELLTDVDDASRSMDPIADTVRIIETILDTLIVERVDTVYMDKPTNSDVTKAMITAADELEFEHDKAIILKKSHGDLESLVNILAIREELSISLDGHTDSDGTEEYNMRLSKNRVEAVKKFLVANGIEASRIKTSYHGESKPIADNSSEEGKSQNRRVDMKIISK